MTDQHGRRLHQQRRHPLSELATLGPDIAPLTTGVYALWLDNELVYIGMVRKNPADTTNPQARGIAGRLNTYRLAKINTDFPLACALRWVIPAFDEAELQQLADGTLDRRALQGRTRQWISKNITFSAVECDAGTAALVERDLRTGTANCPPPALNPIKE